MGREKRTAGAAVAVAWLPSQKPLGLLVLPHPHIFLAGREETRGQHVSARASRERGWLVGGCVTTTHRVSRRTCRRHHWSCRTRTCRPWWTRTGRGRLEGGKETGSASEALHRSACSHPGRTLGPGGRGTRHRGQGQGAHHGGHSCAGGEGCENEVEGRSGAELCPEAAPAA